MPGVTGSLRKEEYYPCFYTLLLGPSGSGKGCINILLKLVDYWHRYVYDNSRCCVEEYKKQQEAADLYKAQQRNGRATKQVGPPPEDPVPVRQKQLRISGYTTTARMIEQLDVNSPYASLLYESELESVSNTWAQDFGGYGYLLRQSYHHERISCSSKTNGTFFVEHPQISFLAAGTPGMLPQIVSSTEDGLYSRFLIYRITGPSPYLPLDSCDNSKSSVRYYENLGMRVLDMAIHLDGSPTFVSFSDKQRKRLDRYFEREYYNANVFGNEDVSSVVLRHRLAIFRIAMTLTGIRKGEKRSTETELEIADDDFDTAFEIGKVCLRHSMLVSTSLKHGNNNAHYKMPDAQLSLFAAMSDEFKTSAILEEASVRKISRASVFRMLKKAQAYSLVSSLGGGYYRKTDAGKKIVGDEKG